MFKGVSRVLLFSACFALLIFAFNCSTETPTGFSIFQAAQGEATGANLFFTGLRNSTRGGYHFEAWVVMDQRFVSLGKFLIDPDGNIVDLDGNPIDRFDAGENVLGAERIDITLEPFADADGVPSRHTILSGAVEGGVANLQVSLPEGFLGRARGKYFLATPTDRNSDENEFSGVWFIDPKVGPGLSLPFLPDAWKYEGWVQTRRGIVSTGKFVLPSGMDESNIHGFPFGAPPPPFPGEDFFEVPPRGMTFPLDLRGARLFITIEPFPDDSESLPFQLELLSDDIPVDAIPGRVYQMNNVAKDFPTGQAIIY